jgi:hypothetical protein
MAVPEILESLFFESNRDFLVVPEYLESLLWVNQRVCGCSRNSGIGVSSQ